MKTKALLLLITIALLASFYMSPHIAANNMRMALEAKDADKVSEYVNYPLLKENLKASFGEFLGEQSSESNSEFESIATAFTGLLVDSMIDELVTPENLSLLLKGDEKLNNGSAGNLASSAEDQTVTSMSYEDFNTFVISLSQKDRPEENVQLVFGREGIAGWKLKALRLPDINQLIPTSASDQNTDLVSDEPVEVDTAVTQPQNSSESTEDCFARRYNEIRSASIEELENSGDFGPYAEQDLVPMGFRLLIEEECGYTHE